MSKEKFTSTPSRVEQSRLRKTEAAPSPSFPAPLEELDRIIAACAGLKQLSIEEYSQTRGASEREAQASIEHAAELLKEFLGHLGIQASSSFVHRLAGGADYWDVHTHDTEDAIPSVPYALETMRNMRALEEARAGACLKLFQRQGIRNFARFSPEFWIRQYDVLDQHAPYMVVVMPSELARIYVTESAVYERLQADLEKLDPPHLVRVIELDSLVEMYRAFARLNKTYNTGAYAHPIQLALFDGHGLDDHLAIGDRKLFARDHLKNPRVKTMLSKQFTHAFSKRAMFLLASCYAAGVGERDAFSIGEALKQKLSTLVGKKIKVVATTSEATPFKALTPRLTKKGALRLEVSSQEGEEGEPVYEKL